MLREWNDLNGALAAAQQAVSLAEQWRQVDTLHYSLTCLVDAYLALGDLSAARSAMERSKWIASKVSDWFLEISEIMEAEINLACGNWDQVLQWMLDSWSSTGVYVWDLVAAVNATDPALCPEGSLSVDILVAPGPDQGRTVITDQPQNTTVCLDPDTEQIKALATAILGR